VKLQPPPEVNHKAATMRVIVQEEQARRRTFVCVAGCSSGAKPYRRPYPARRYEIVYITEGARLLARAKDGQILSVQRLDDEGRYHATVIGALLRRILRERRNGESERHCGCE
jgi:hypothetical protein